MLYESWSYARQQLFESAFFERDYFQVNSTADESSHFQNHKERFRTHIAGVSVAELAHRFGTPLYVYDADLVRRRCADLAAWDTIRFAQKACSNLAVLNVVRSQGGMVDAVSAGEIHRAMRAGWSSEVDRTPGSDGLPPVHHIVYTADIFDRESLSEVSRLGLHVNCGSADMLEQLAQHVPGANVTLRVNPGFGHGHSQKTNTGGEGSKHGIWHEDISEVLRRAEWAGISVTGLHMHIGSGTDLEHLAEVAGSLERVALDIGRSLNTISAGGGLPVPYKPEEVHADLRGYFQLWDATRVSLEKKFGHRIRLEIEPGRFLTAESGYLITEVRATKTMGTKKYILVDAGFNTLARPVLYGSWHPMSLCPGEGNLMIERGASEEVVVGGPLCESGDIFTQSDGGFVSTRNLPPAHVGDHLVIEIAGAYGFVMASNYNSKPFPAEVLVDAKEARLVRIRQTSEDLVRGETL